MIITIKPHHYIDMIKLYGSGLSRFVPDTEYHHSFYCVGNSILNDPDVKLSFTIECDDVCSNCKFESKEGTCQDTVKNLPGYNSKDLYNKMIDRKLIDLLGLDIKKTYTSKEYCELVYENRNVIFQVWTIENQEVTQRRYDLFSKGCERYLQK